MNKTNHEPDTTEIDNAKKRSVKRNLFQISKMLLKNPAANLPENIRTDIIKATIRWFKPEYAVDVPGKETLLRTLKHMRRSLIAGEFRKMSAWIDKSGIRRDWPELPEYRIRRLAVHAMFAAYQDSWTISDFRERTPFYVEQSLRKISCRSPHCLSFRIDGNGKSCCTSGSGEVF